MKLRKSVTFITAAMMLASVIAGSGSIGAAAAESTTADYAIAVALKDAGLTEDEVTIEEVEKGTEQGASVYEIEFWTDVKDYEYDVAVLSERTGTARRKASLSTSSSLRMIRRNTIMILPSRAERS